MKLREWIPCLYRQDAKAILFSFAPVLLEAAECGDAIAQHEMQKKHEKYSSQHQNSCWYCRTKASRAR